MASISPLVSKISAPGYTPGRRDLPGLVALLAAEDENVRKDAERALLRGGPPFAVPLAAALAERTPHASCEVQVRLARLLGKIAEAGESIHSALVLASRSEDERVRREAWRALGKIGGAETELLAAWERADLPLSERRALASALGTKGGESALGALASYESDDAEVARRVGKSRTTLRRTLLRDDANVALDPGIVLPRAVQVDYTCRSGLEGLLAADLGKAVVDARPGRVRARMSGSLGGLYRTRLALGFAFPLDVEPIRKDEDLADTIVRALSRPRTLELMRLGASGPIRFRLAFTSGGHKRALVWRIAALLERSFPELVNDPRESPWQVDVDVGARSVALSLAPRGLVDSRFSYRLKDVPAASHPTIAAALAKLAEARPDDVVWDPFVGSGTELVERAKLGPYAKLIGTDVSPDAIASARANLGAAAVDADLSCEDVTRASARTVDAIVTNPPMGRRVVPEAGLVPLLTTFIEVAARSLRSGGRIVWLSPSPGPLGKVAERAGLTRVFASKVDVGGFSATLERWENGPTAGGVAPVAPRRPRVRR